MRPIYLSPLRLVAAALVASVLLLLTGCGTGKSPRIQPPRTDLQVKAKGWDVQLSGEKDTSLGQLTVKIYDGTNIVTDVALVSLVSTNSVGVVTATGTGQSAIIDSQGNVINAQGQIIGHIVQAGADIAAKLTTGGKVPLPIAPPAQDPTDPSNPSNPTDLQAAP